MAVNAMTATLGARLGEFAAHQYVTSRIAHRVGKHKTLCVGVLYGVAIAAVLAVVARL